MTFKPQDRAAEKELTRQEDQRVIRDGLKTVQEVQLDNAVFAFPGVRIRFPGQRDR